MERVCEMNLDFWCQFSGVNQKRAIKYYGNSQDKIRYNLLAGVLGFRDSLLSYGLNSRCSPHELWILYASIKPINQDTATPMEKMKEIFIRSLGSQNVHIGFYEDWPTYVQDYYKEIEKCTKQNS